jgi:cellulose biosynthesis protein BcsQ
MSLSVVALHKSKTMIYAFWNNKGGTGKTSLIFQAICRYAELHRGQKILAIDLCPQANLSELMLGGLEGNGSDNLNTLYETNGRVSIGGYFQNRLPSPFEPRNIDPDHYITQPNKFNVHIPSNIDLVAGDRIVELQSNAISTLSNTQIPGIDTWLKVIDWLKDLIDATGGRYQTIFIDTNPSFSMYTQIALSASQRLVLPVMADDSSRRAVRNAFTLVHGIQLPAAIYDQYSFSRKLQNAMRPLPQVHLIVKNRLTQYMGPATAYQNVLTSIDDDIRGLMRQNPFMFTFANLSQGIAEVRDFHTTGAVSFALGKPFSQMTSGVHVIRDGETQIRADYLKNCQEAIDALVASL